MNPVHSISDVREGEMKGFTCECEGVRFGLTSLELNLMHLVRFLEMV